MPRQKPLQAVLMATPDDTEAQFYEALHQCDLDRIMAVWADDEDITCIFPGGSPHVGARDVRSAFEEWFSHGGLPVRPAQVRRVVMPGCAVHHVIEEIRVASAEGLHVGHVIATNVYAKTAQGWRMVLHHASQGTADDLVEGGDTPTVLH